MSKILAFAGSNAKNSINYKLVEYTSNQLKEHSVDLLNFAHYPFPMYSIDLEQEEGFSNALIELKNQINAADGLILSVSEHNSMPSAYFKNVLDWLSRIERNFLENTKVLLLSTSPGKRGGMSAREAVGALLPRFGAEVVAQYSLPSFGENFSPETGVQGDEKDGYMEVLKAFQDALAG